MSKANTAADEITRLIDERFGAPISVDADVPRLDSLTNMLGRRTHRSYTDVPVEEDLLRLLFACALSAPSKSDLQQADIIHVRDAEKRRAFGDLISGMSWVKTAPVFLVFCGNGRRVRQLGEMRGETFANDHLDAFFNAAVDAAIVMAAFISAAEAVGLGCCPISAVRNDCSAVDRLLELPDHVFPVAGLCVGYPAEEGRLSRRLPLEVTVHADAFDEAKLEAQIRRYDERRAAAMPESDRYYWSEAKARQYAKPQRTDFGDYIRSKGFKLT